MRQQVTKNGMKDPGLFHRSPCKPKETWICQAVRSKFVHVALLGQGGWRRRPPEVPSNYSHSGILRLLWRTIFFVKIKINNNSSIDLNTLNDLQISKVKKVVRKSFIPPHTSFIRLYSRMHVYNMQYVHLWKIYTIYAYTYTYHIYEYMRLVKRRENTALFENPYWPLRSYQHLGFLTQVFAMEGIITLKGIADIFLTKRNSKQFPYSSIN